MKTRTPKEFFKLFYRAHRMAAKGNNPMGVITEALMLAYTAANDDVMMCRLYKAKFSAEMALISRARITPSLAGRLRMHKAGCPF